MNCVVTHDCISDETDKRTVFTALYAPATGPYASDTWNLHLVEGLQRSFIAYTSRIRQESFLESMFDDFLASWSLPEPHQMPRKWYA
jgi:hypothetical protein